MQYSMLFWSKPSDTSIETKISIVFSALSVFSKMGCDYTPQYITAKCKSSACRLEWTLAGFTAELLKNRINKGNPLLDELGYSASFYSSPDNGQTIGFKVSLGNQSPQFYDVVSVSFPSDLCQSDIFIKRVPIVFAECANILQPYWGGVTELQFLRRYGPYIVNGIPSSVHWLNMWSESVQTLIGKRRIAEVLDGYGINFSNGMFAISSAPIDLKDHQSVQMCDSINKMLGL